MPKIYMLVHTQIRSKQELIFKVIRMRKLRESERERESGNSGCGILLLLMFMIITTIDRFAIVVAAAARA